MAGGMKAGLRVPVLAPAVALLAFFLLPGTPQALDIGALPLRPGEVHPQPRQRPLTEIAALPEHEVVCPACATVVSVPEVDKLMRAPADGGERPPWRLHAASRDADLCPYPGSTMLSYQADIIVCPACGFAAGEESYATRPSVEAQAWINATFRDSLRQTQRLLLGERGADLPEEEVIAFFNHQARIPDVVRTEHFRVLSLAKKDPYLLRAEATWRSAWALRREVVAPPRGDFLARQTGSVRERLDKTGRSQDGVAGEAEALRYLLGKTRSGRDRLAPGEQLAARLMLAGLLVRLGENLEAEEELAALQRFCHERFVRPEDDPLWPTTAGRSRDRRRRELEDIRSETERELDSRFAMVRQQTEYLQDAADCLRQAVAEGEVDGRPEEALFYAYLTGEFLRRAGNLPLASEWFRVVLDLAEDDSAVATAARRQAAVVREEAGSGVNLLAAFGGDSALFDRVRRICGRQ